MEAVLKNGPLKGTKLDVEPVAGRPPSTLDVPSKKKGTLRYCLAELTQGGMSADYAYLYAVDE